MEPEALPLSVKNTKWPNTGIFLKLVEGKW